VSVVARETGLTSIVVVAADSGPLLMTSIAAALATSAPVEVILVDNASVDGEPERVMAAFAHDARLRCLRNGSNLGFGPACNRGVSLAHGDALVFLNPDCTIEPDTIAALRATAADSHKLGVLGVEILSPGGKPARGNRRREPTLRRASMTFSGLAHFESRWPALGGVEMPAFRTERRPAVEIVDAVSGAFLFLPRRVFDEIGGFDEAYFVHVEDLDLCRRVRDAGYAVAIVYGLHAVHAQGGSSRHRPLFVAWHKHRGMWRYFRKFDPAAHNPLAGAFAWIGIWAHFALAAAYQFARGYLAPRGPTQPTNGEATRAA
jgi:GT2 family glycosyltransferase